MIAQIGQSRRAVVNPSTRRMIARVVSSEVIKDALVVTLRAISSQRPGRGIMPQNDCGWAQVAR